MTLGERLRQTRRELGLSQNQVAGDQITRNMLSQLENDLASPSVKTLSYLAQKLGVTMSWLLGEEGNRTERLLTENARDLFRAGVFKSCMELLADVQERSEEQCLLLCRSAVAYGTHALELLSLQEAERAAHIAANCEGLYLCEQDRIAVLELELRISLLKDKQDQAAMKQWETLCHSWNEENGRRIILLHSCLLAADLEQAEQLLSAFYPMSPFEEGCYALFLGWAEVEKKNYVHALEHLTLAEQNTAVGPAYRSEIYRLLEVCYREQNDFRLAYHYAVLRLSGR